MSPPLINPGVGPVAGRRRDGQWRPPLVSVFRVAAAARQAESFLEEERVGVMEPIGRERMVLVVLVCQAGQGVGVTAAIEVIRAEK